MRSITDYKNFWLIWLSAAGSPRGMSLFSIQNLWGIKTNYLYHEEAGLGKPLYTVMIRQGYLEKEGKRLRARYEWIAPYMKERYGTLTPPGMWSPDGIILSKWPIIQDFLQKNPEKLFSQKALKVLYKGSRDCLGDNGQHIFADLFLQVLYNNLTVFCRKYNATIVLRIILTATAMFPDRNLLGYMQHLGAELKGRWPVVIANEVELNRLMCPLVF
jgi:hypothetical protein